MLVLLGVLLVVCAGSGLTVCEKARQQQAALGPNVNYGTLDAQSQRRLRILQATLRRCSTPDGSRPAYPTRTSRAAYVPRPRRAAPAPFDEAAFRAQRDRELQEINDSLGGAMGRVAQEDFAQATEDMIRQRRRAAGRATSRAAPSAPTAGAPFDEAAFRAQREREMEEINESLGGGMGRVAREDFAQATEDMVRQRRAAAGGYVVATEVRN